ASLFGACSKDGKAVYFVKSDWPRTLWRAGLGEEDPIKVLEVTAGEKLLCPLGVSADGESIAYGVGRESGNWLAKIPVLVHSLRKNTTIARVEISGKAKVIGWSLDGSGFTYVLEGLEASGIWEQPLTGGSPRKLASLNDS